MERSVDGAIRSRLLSGGRSHRLLVGAAAILVAGAVLSNTARGLGIDHA